VNDFPQTLKRTLIAAVLTAFTAATATRLLTSRETQQQISHYLGIAVLALLILAPVAWLLARHGWPDYFANDRPIDDEPPPRPPPTKPIKPPSKDNDEGDK
jgi:hypothetical protein